MKPLIVEDQDTMAQYLKKARTKSGYIVDLMHDDEEGLLAATSRSYDLIIVDGQTHLGSSSRLVSGLQQSMCAYLKTPV